MCMVSHLSIYTYENGILKIIAQLFCQLVAFQTWKTCYDAPPRGRNEIIAIIRQLSLAKHEDNPLR